MNRLPAETGVGMADSQAAQPAIEPTQPDPQTTTTTSVPAIPGSLDARSSERSPRPATGEH
jgi:hypothetical protein